MAVTSAATTAAALMRVARHRSSEPRRQLAVGDAAPEFALQASDGRTYRLIDYRHKQVVVLVWFPKAFTTGCTSQCQSIGAHAEALRARGAIVFGANVDTPDTNRQFATALDLAFPILSDPSGTTARAYGVLGASGLPSRWTFYIGADGRVLSIDKAVRVSTNGHDIERALHTWTGEAPVPEW